MVMRRTTKRTGKGAASDPSLALPETPTAARLEEIARRENPWSDMPEDTFAEEADDDAEEASAEEAAAPAEAEGQVTHAPDDALGLYLRQMGAIPLLSRDQELPWGNG